MAPVDASVMANAVIATRPSILRVRRNGRRRFVWSVSELIAISGSVIVVGPGLGAGDSSKTTDGCGDTTSPQVVNEVVIRTRIDPNWGRDRVTTVSLSETHQVDGIFGM